MTLPEYMALPDKDAEGSPDKFYYEGRKDELKFIINQTPSDTTDTIFMVVLLPIEDFDDQADNLDFPREWFRTLKYALAKDLAPEFGVRLNQDIVTLANESMAIAQTFNPETTAIYFQPDRDDG
jgi:hypothetical protein